MKPRERGRTKCSSPFRRAIALDLSRVLPGVLDSCMRGSLRSYILATSALTVFAMLRSASSRLRLVALLNTAKAMLTTSASASPYIVAVDGVATASALTSKEFLLNSPSGAYTTARTCSQARRLFEWETHVTLSLIHI